MKRLPILIAVAALCAMSCQREFQIEKRAKQQVYASLPSELENICQGAHDWRIEDLKTVYANDSICLLQFTARFRDAQDEKRVRDYRYIYLMDMLMSKANRRPVFCEEFRNMLCLPDDLIRKCRKEVESSGESVYDASFGSCFPVRVPFDAPQQ